MNERMSNSIRLAEIQADHGLWHAGGIDGAAYQLALGAEASRLAAERGACMVYSEATGMCLAMYQRLADGGIGELI